MTLRSKIALLAIVASSAAHANYFCTGLVTSVAVDKLGTVSVIGIQGLESALLCNLNSQANGISPELCRTIYGTLLTAKLTARPVTFAYSDNLTCETHPAWATLTGWYFGPRVE